jgi:hypothetical protein
MSGTLTAGTEVTVTLVKQARQGIDYPATALADDGVHAVVRAPWSGPPVRDFGFVRFVSGDVFTEHYWRDRWYAVKEVRSGHGVLKGWYCDMTRPAQVTGSRVTSVDLELDLWVPAGRTGVLRLDEEEFLASGLPDSDPPAARAARAAQEELAGIVRDAAAWERLLAHPASG